MAGLYHLVDAQITRYAGLGIWDSPRIQLFLPIRLSMLCRTVASPLVSTRPTLATPAITRQALVQSFSDAVTYIAGELGRGKSRKYAMP